MRRQTSVQITQATERQVEHLTAQGFGSFTDIVRIAIDRMYQQEVTMNGWRMITDDRVAQVGWISELAANIAQNLGEGTAEELVKYALSDEGHKSWGIELPQWFDDHDRQLLIEYVAESL